MAVRTCTLDELCLKLVAGGVDTVVNLAAGLDTRPYRLKLPPTLRWVEADLPGIIQYKTEKLALEKPVCRLERHIVDLSDDSMRRTFLDAMNADAKKTLVITEGLLGYLSPENVSALACELFSQSTVEWWRWTSSGQSFSPGRGNSGRNRSRKGRYSSSSRRRKERGSSSRSAGESISFALSKAKDG